MGFFSITPEEKERFHRKHEYQESVIAAHGFSHLKGWFGKLGDEFFTKHKYAACYVKDGKIYGWLHVAILLGLEYADDSEFSRKTREKWLAVVPPDAEPWLERKEVLKKELGINYD